MYTYWNVTQEFKRGQKLCKHQQEKGEELYQKRKY